MLSSGESCSLITSEKIIIPKRVTFWGPLSNLIHWRGQFYKKPKTKPSRTGARTTERHAAQRQHKPQGFWLPEKGGQGTEGGSIRRPCQGGSRPAPTGSSGLSCQVSSTLVTDETGQERSKAAPVPLSAGTEAGTERSMMCDLQKEGAEFGKASCDLSRNY